MSQRRLLLLIIAVTVLCGACKRSTPAANIATTQVSPASQTAADKAIETEIVTAAPISGEVTATGKVQAPEDRTAVIGPVNEGRIVKLYAGQGSRVRKGQYAGRHAGQAPEVDSVTYVLGDGLQPGQFVRVVCEGAQDYDLIGRPMEAILPILS